MQSSQLLIIILLVSNLAATIWFGAISTTNPARSDAQVTSEHSLPASIDEK